MATMDVKDAGGSTVSIEKPLAPGRAAAAASRPVVLSTEDFAAVGATNETAPVSDTASSGLNGRLQRIAQRLSSIISVLPTALGSNGGLKIEGVSSGQAVPVSAASGTIVDGAIATMGAKTDAKSTATDATSVSLMSVFKQISASVQSLVTGTVLAAGTAVIGKVAIDQTTDGTTNLVAAKQSGTWTVTGSGGTFPITDSGGSLTVDAPVATPVYVRLSDGSAAITTLPVSLASVPSHAVTNAGTFAVQASSVTPGSSANNLGKAEDAVHSSGDIGVYALGTRQDTPSATAGTSGDYQGAAFDAKGRQWVNKAATAINDASDVTLTNGSETQLLASNTARQCAIIVADPANTVNIRIGKTGQVGSARGALLQPGQSISLETTAAIYGYAGAASQKVSLLSLED